MSSNSDRDLADYLTGNSPNEDGTLFLSATDGTRDPWAPFFCGILIGLAGSALVPAVPWIAGALIAIGYTTAACSLTGSKRRFAKALLFGFAATAILGAGLAATGLFAPRETWRFFEAAGGRHLIFPSLALMPWALGVLKYVYALLLPRRRRTAVPVAQGA